jgi:hypothetical protein
MLRAGYSTRGKVIFDGAAVRALVVACIVGLRAAMEANDHIRRRRREGRDARLASTPQEPQERSLNGADQRNSRPEIRQP